MDFWESHERIRELGKGSYGLAVLVRSKSSGREYVLKEVDISRMTRKDAAEAEQEAKVVPPFHHATMQLTASGILYKNEAVEQLEHMEASLASTHSKNDTQ
jgi:hypothetical protein